MHCDALRSDIAWSFGFTALRLKSMKQTSIGIIGLGKMGEALVQGIQNSSHKSNYKIAATTRTSESAKEVEKRLKISCHTDNKKLAKDSDLIVLAVKPHQAQAVLEEIAKSLDSKKTIVSICASITTEQMHAWSGGKAASIRAMPNTPALIGEGMTVLCPGKGVSAAALANAESVMATVGKTVVLEENLMDGVTGLSGCGPAFIYLVIEALSEAGVKVGLPRKTATLLAAQTLLGSAKMVLDRGVHPAQLKDEVTTPAGCTIDGLMALEEGKLRVTLIKAVLASAKRSRNLREPL